MSESAEKGEQPRKFGGPENVGLPALIQTKKVLASLDITKEIRAISQTEDVGIHEIHGASQVQFKSIKTRVFRSKRIDKGKEAIEKNFLCERAHIW